MLFLLQYTIHIDSIGWCFLFNEQVNVHRHGSRPYHQSSSTIKINQGCQVVKSCCIAGLIGSSSPSCSRYGDGKRSSVARRHEITLRALKKNTSDSDETWMTHSLALICSCFNDVRIRRQSHDMFLIWDL